MLVDVQIFKDPFFSHFGCGDNGSPQRSKPFKAGLLVWWDDDNEWVIEVWVFRPKQHTVLIRQNGKPTERTSLRWEKWCSDEVDEFIISKVSVGRFANETVINITPSLTFGRIQKILELVPVGEFSDRLPVVL